MLLRGGRTSIHKRQYQEKFMTNNNRFFFNSISSTAKNANAIATDFDAQFFSVWIKPKFRSTSLNPTMMKAQELSTTARFHYRGKPKAGIGHKMPRFQGPAFGCDKIVVIVT